MITANDLISKFQYALSNKWGYIWGAAGGKWTQAQQDRATREQTVKYGQKWVGHNVADCSGMFTWAFKQLGSTMYHGSDTMYRKWCVENGTLSKGQRTDGQELKPGTAVFTWKEKDKKYGHVGLFIGNGTVIEAYGTQKGVITSKVTETRWTHWGELKDVSFNGVEPAPAPAPEPQPAKLPTIRRGNRNTYVKQLQTMLDKLGYNLGICGVDGDFGTATEKAVKEFQQDHKLGIDGICGPKTWTALQAAVDGLKPQPEPVKVYSVIISGLDLTQAQALAGNYPGAVIKEGSADA